MKHITMERDGQQVKVIAQKIGEVLWYHIDGETRSYQPEKKYGSGGAGKASLNPGSIVAPMPGKITKIQKSAGDKVQAGEVILVMEAMKMEYALETDIDGTLEGIFFAEQELVNAGDELAKVVGAESDE